MSYRYPFDGMFLLVTRLWALIFHCCFQPFASKVQRLQTATVRSGESEVDSHSSTGHPEPRESDMKNSRIKTSMRKQRNIEKLHTEFPETLRSTVCTWFVPESYCTSHDVCMNDPAWTKASWWDNQNINRVPWFTWEPNVSYQTFSSAEMLHPVQIAGFRRSESKTIVDLL